MHDFSFAMAASTSSGSVLSELLAQAWTLMVRARRQLLWGIVAISFLSVLMQVVVGDRVGTEAATQVRKLLGEQRYQQLVSEMRLQGAGDAAQLQNFSGQVATVVQEKFASLSSAEQRAFLSSAIQESLIDLLPVLSIFLPLFLLLTVWSRTFFLHLGLHPEWDFSTAIGRSTQKFLPLLVVFALLFLCSLAWLPGVTFFLIPYSPFAVLLFLISFVPPAILVPRFALAPVICLTGGGVVRSVGQSFRRSKGRYWKIVGNVLAALLLSTIALWFLLTVSDIVGAVLNFSYVLLFLYWLRQALSFGSAAYRTVFLARLSDSLLQGPQKMMARKVR